MEFTSQLRNKHGKTLDNVVEDCQYTHYQNIHIRKITYKKTHTHTPYKTI